MASWVFYLTVQQDFHWISYNIEWNIFMFILDLFVNIRVFFFLTESSKSSPAKTPKKVKMEEYKLTREQKGLIKNDTANKKVWDEAMQSLSLGPVRMPISLTSSIRFWFVTIRHVLMCIDLFLQKFLDKVAEVFLCICCQEVVYQPITTECQHNVCRVRSHPMQIECLDSLR